MSRLWLCLIFIILAFTSYKISNMRDSQYFSSNYMAKLNPQFIENTRDKVAIFFESFDEGQCKDTNNHNRSDVVKAMFLGKISKMDKGLLDNFRKSGLIHLLSASGIHCILFAIFMEKLLSVLMFLPLLNRFNLPKNTINYLNIFSAIFFLMMTGFCLPTFRSALFISLNSFEKISDLKFQEYRNLIISIGITMILRPNEILGISFILSVTSLIGVAIAQEMKVDEFSGGVIIGLSTLIPIAWFFGEFPTLAVFSNIFAIPFTEIILMPIICFSFLLPKFIVAFGIDILINCAHFFAKFSFSTYKLPFAGVILIVTIFASIFLYYKTQKKKFIIVSLLLSMMLLCLKINSHHDNITMTFFDVGNADAALMEIEKGGRHQTIMFDVGPKLFPLKNPIINYLNHKGIRQIDTLILSHSDSDHFGGYESVDEAVPIKTLVANIDEKIQKKISRKIIKNPNETIIAPEKFHNQYITIYNQIFELSSKENGNNKMITALITINSKNKIFMAGDMTKKQEEYFVKLHTGVRANFMKIAHHGSKNSSTDEMLSTLQPKFAIISVGKKNHYHHPSPETLLRLKNHNIQTHMTKNEGNITYSWNIENQENIYEQTNPFTKFVNNFQYTNFLRESSKNFSNKLMTAYASQSFGDILHELRVFFKIKAID